MEALFQIETNVGEVTIAPVQQIDAWGICDFVVANEDRLRTFFPKTLAQNLTPELAELFTVKKERQYSLKEEYLYSLKLNAKKVVGLIYIKELQKVIGQGEFAYCIDYNLEGQGVITKAVAFLVDYAFENLELNRLQIIVHKDNVGSIKVAEKSNFNWQQTLTKAFTPPGKNAMDMELYERIK